MRLLVFLLNVGTVLGQITLGGSGYTNPAALRLAPGQIVRMFVSGTKTVLPEGSRGVSASRVPLPHVLGGFSVRVQQAEQVFDAPLVAVEQSPVCLDGGSEPAGCLLTALTVQVPFEIAVPVPGLGVLTPASTLIVVDNGTESGRFLFTPVTDNLHVLTACDSNGRWWNARAGFDPACTPTVTHADGSPVTAGSPARAGETVVVYAWGLGKTAPAVKTGEASPSPAATLLSDHPFFARTVGLTFDFRVNAGPSLPYVNRAVMRPPGLPLPEFVGLTPGQVGLYQMNVKLPDAFPAVDPCTTPSVLTGNPTGALGSFAYSNLTISLGAASSFDGAAICVEPGA